MEPSVTNSEKIFIEFLISYIVDTNPGDLYTNVSEISKHIQDKYGAKHELNLYRKSFGNLKDCVKSPATSKVVILEGLRFNFVHHSKMEQAHAGGIITDVAWAKYLEGRKSMMTKHLNMCKMQKMNICKTCEHKYFLTNNKPGNCMAKGDEAVCEPAWDFSKSENVLECGI